VKETTILSKLTVFTSFACNHKINCMVWRSKIDIIYVNIASFAASMQVWLRIKT